MDNKLKKKFYLSNNGIKIIIENLNSHPHCPHGPTLLFSKLVKNAERRFFACAACRDRKLCNFFIWAEDAEKVTKIKLKAWNNERIKYLRDINHKKLFIQLHKTLTLDSQNRTFCTTCSCFVLENSAKHDGHSIIKNISDSQIKCPTTFLPSLENDKKEAQYLFSNDSVKFIVETLIKLNYKYVICIGTPRIHEYIQSVDNNLSSILLDFDKRFHNFFGPLEFCWYNIFNNHFFFKEAESVFNDFLNSTGGSNTVLITDPPFGGRTEPLVETFNKISAKYKKIKNNELEIFWIFPYFMEPQIINKISNFKMLDYKIQYDNHILFQDGPKGRKQGSPVRIFTNVNPSKITLPENEGYKFCKFCDKSVAKENKHCKICKGCMSKNGETYKHCGKCKKCVKPRWEHCEKCSKCVQKDHNCCETRVIYSMTEVTRKRKIQRKKTEKYKKKFKIGAK